QAMRFTCWPATTCPAAPSTVPWTTSALAEAEGDVAAIADGVTETRPKTGITDAIIRRTRIPAPNATWRPFLRGGHSWVPDYVSARKAVSTAISAMPRTA